MSSHHDWVERVWAEHEEKRPFAPENGQPLRFSIGDSVIYTNAAGFEFTVNIIGYHRPAGQCGQYAQGARYLVSSSAPWFPVAESELRLA